MEEQREGAVYVGEGRGVVRWRCNGLRGVLRGGATARERVAGVMLRQGVAERGLATARRSLEWRG